MTAATRHASPATRERRLLPGWRWVAVAGAFPIAGYIAWKLGGLAVPWRLAMPVLFALGWCATTAGGINVDEQFTVFGAYGAVVCMLLSGLVLARFTAARAQAT